MLTDRMRRAEMTQRTPRRGWGPPGSLSVEDILTDIGDDADYYTAETTTLQMH
jgi:hypothetical protein